MRRVKMARSSALRRMLTGLLSAALICTAAFPGGTAYGAERGGEPTASLSDLGRLTAEENEADTETYAGEAKLYQALNEADFRTYASQKEWYMGIHSIESFAELKTVHENVDYGGNVTYETYVSTPSEPGMRFVILNVELEKLEAAGGSLAADAMTLTINGTVYARRLDDGFLVRHNYSMFPNTPILVGNKTGDVVFEVTAADAEAVSDWKTAVSNGEIVLQAGDYTLQSPLFQQNIYGNAPLTGIMLFRTDREAAKITVTAKGRTSAEDDITYDVETSGREHQVPIFGLYAKGETSVEIVLYDKSGNEIDRNTQKITTPSNQISQLYTVVERVDRSDSYRLENGLTVLNTTDMAVVDTQGDVRWFRNARKDTNPSPGNKVTSRGTILCSNTKYGTHSDPTVLYEMTWMGKILGQYLNDDGANKADLHHETNESWDGESILYCFNESIAETGMKEIDRQTGALIDVTYVSDFLKKGSGDWAHQNTITPTADGRTYLLSFRHLDMVCKYDSLTKEIVWIFAKNKSGLLADNPQLAGKFIELDMNIKDQNKLTPEYFNHQHHVTPLDYIDDRGDFDGDPDTEDIMLFDNGNDRGYSRIVHYRINTKTKTAVQVFSWGKGDQGFYSSMYGSAQYLPETGNYLGVGYGGQVVEVTPKGQEVMRIVLSPSKCPIYRAFRIRPELFPKGFQRLGTVKGKAFNKIGSESEFIKTELPEQSDTGRAAITEIYQYEHQLTVKGTASLNGKVYLTADDGKNQYYAALPSAGTAFNNIGSGSIPISMNHLPPGRYNLGILVVSGNQKQYTATTYYIQKSGAIQTIKTDDAGQREIVEALIAASQKPSNSLLNPLVMVNPFDKAPLSAVAAFYTAKPGTVKVTVKGKPAENGTLPADVTYEVDDIRTANHVVPIIGLYPDYENTVVLEAEGKTSVITVKTGAVDSPYLRTAEVTVAEAHKDEIVPGLTFMTPAGAQTVPFAIDGNGELRWAYICPAAAPVETKPLRNGRMLIPSDRASADAFVTDAETVLEVDLVGRIYAEYFLEGQPHHEAFERANGNLVFALSRRNNTSIEDYMVEIDRMTGKTLRTWDFRKILGIPDYDASYDPEAGGTDDPNGPQRAQPSIVAKAGPVPTGFHPYGDWFHQNSLSYEEGDPDDPSDDYIYVTARHQSALIKINAQMAEGENPGPEGIEWIYTDPSWLPQSKYDLKAFLLTPKGSDTNRTARQEETETEEEAESQSLHDAAEAEPDMQMLPKLSPETEQERLPEVEAEAEPQSLPDETELNLNEAAGEKAESADESASSPKSVNVLQANAETKDAKPAGGSEHPYIYAPHAVEHIANGDLLVYDNATYGSKTQPPKDLSDMSGQFSRAVRLHVDDAAKTFEIQWEYGAELGDEYYTPFIGDVDYIGSELSEGQRVTDEHYLVNFGGLTKNAAGGACDVVWAMLYGTMSAEIQECSENGVIWKARFTGSKGNVSTVYRAERVDMSQVPVSGADYASYTSIENRGMYLNTPQSALNQSKVDQAAEGIIPISWSMLYDEGNRLVGKFTLPHVMTDTASKWTRVKSIYVVLNLQDGRKRIYDVGEVAATAISEGYYKFEIMKDTEAAQIQLLVEREDGRWILGDTGEVASAAMSYVTGEIPVIDPVQPVIEARRDAEAPIMGQLAAAKETESGTSAEAGTLLLIQKGALEPGKRYIYTDPETGKETELVYSVLHGGYLAVLDGKKIAANEAAADIRAVPGTVSELRSGVVSDSRYESVMGAARTAILPEDMFYLYNQLKKKMLPYRDVLRTMAMDVNGDCHFTNMDITQLIKTYINQ